jgi:transposase
MPRPHPPEFRCRAVELASQRGPDGERLQPVAKTASDLAISESCLRNWMAQADIDTGARPGLSTDERKELAELRRRNRVLEMEVEILKRASRRRYQRHRELGSRSLRAASESAAGCGGSEPWMRRAWSSDRMKETTSSCVIRRPCSTRAS